MKHLLLTSALLLTLAACAGPVATVETAPAPSPVEVEAAQPGEAVVRLAQAGPAALGFAEQVAAGCLLDGVLGGAAMIVDRATGQITIVGEEEELVVLEVAPAGSGSRLEISGPAVEDPAMRQAVLAQIERAARTGQTSCPALPA